MATLGNLSQPNSEAAYNARYPEPGDKDSIEHLIWAATRVNPNERPDIHELCSKFENLIEKQEALVA